MVAVAVTLSSAGCGGGESATAKADDQVCTARSDIQKQVNDLKAMTSTTITVDAVQGDLSAIQTDLKSIQDATPDLADQRKEQVQAANETFAAAVNDVVSTALQSLSLADAQAQLETAVSNLASAYEQSFAKIDCS